MNKLLLVFLATLFLALTSVGTLANQSPETVPPTDDNSAIQPAPEPSPEDMIKQLPIMVDCGIKEAIFDVLRKYGEVPVISMEVIIATPSSGILRQPGMLFMNPDKSTWSLIADFPETGGACIVQNGVNIEAVGDPNNKVSFCKDRAITNLAEFKGKKSLISVYS